MRKVVFVTAGPYFWPHQKSHTAKYEMYSEHFGGYILSFVSDRAWRRIDVGNFRLIGFYIPYWLYNNIVARNLLRTVFVIGTCLRLRWFRGGFDLIVTWDPFMTGVLGWVAARLTGTRVVVEVNGEFGEPKNWGLEHGGYLDRLKFWYVQRVVPFILNRADATKLLYPTMVDAFKGLRHRERFFVFHDLVPIRQFRPGVGATRYGLFLGYPWHRKGVDVLVRAFDRVSGEFPDYSLKVVGMLPEKDEHRDLWAHNPRIEFPGPVMPEDVVDLMAGCSFFVLASRAEGMPRVLMEAMGAHKPIIASAVSGIPYYIQDGVTGLLFPSEDIDALADALRRLMSDPGLANRIGENGFRFVSTELSEERHIEKVLDMFDRVLGVTEGPGPGLSRPGSDHGASPAASVAP